MAHNVERFPLSFEKTDPSGGSGGTQIENINFSISMKPDF
jgi:hypothetical protein